MVSATHTVGDVFRDLTRHPMDHLIRRWNWKSALTSALIRAGIFFTANLSAGMHAAVGAMVAEFVFRSATSGFYGSLIQAFRRAEPGWAAVLVTTVLIPICSHSIEFCIHWLRGTPNLGQSIMASIAFTAFSTLFNLYAMRRGVLIVGAKGDSQSLWSDMKAMPGVIAGFLAVGPVMIWRALRDADRRP